MMPPAAVFGISVLLGFVGWGMIGARYIWPALRGRSRTEALRPVLLLHVFRFVGLAFLVPGVVSPDLPDAFAQPAAYGDLATSLLALLAIATLGTRLGTIIVWVFNIIGTVDLLNAFYQGNRLGVGMTPGLQGAAYFIPSCRFSS
jgi:ABC-type phosphate/phosphonate transport system permease subunit